MRKTTSSRQFIFPMALLLTVFTYHAYYLVGGRARPSEAYRTFFAEWGYIVRYLVHQTPDLVLRGTDGKKLILFHCGEVGSQTKTGGRQTIEQLASRIGPTLRRLSSNGVTVVPVVIPTKMSLYRNRLPGSLRDYERWTKPITFDDREDPAEAHRAVQALLPATTVDLYDTYHAYIAEHPDIPLYPPLDYHWTSTGSALATVSILRQLERMGRTVSEPVWRNLGSEPFGPSYLTDQFPIPPWFVDSKPEFQGTELLVNIEPVSLAPEFRRVILAGTSFSVSALPYRFAGQLRAALHRPLIEFTKGNNGYRGAFKMMREQHFQFQAGDLLVWELPLCCLNLDDSQPEVVDVEPMRRISSLNHP